MVFKLKIKTLNSKKKMDIDMSKYNSNQNTKYGIVDQNYKRKYGYILY